MVDVGDRVELVYTDDEFTSLTPGDRGTVSAIDTIPPEVTPGPGPERQIWVDWDSGSTLALIEGRDRFTVLEGEE